MKGAADSLFFCVRDFTPAIEKCPGCEAVMRLGFVTCTRCWRTVPEMLRDAWLRAGNPKADDAAQRAIFKHFGKVLLNAQLRRNLPGQDGESDVLALLRKSPYFYADERAGARLVECPGCLGAMPADCWVCPGCVKAETGLVDAVELAPDFGARERAWTRLLTRLRERAGRELFDLPTHAAHCGYNPLNGLAVL